MALKQYIPALKYGNKLAVDESNHSIVNVTTTGTAAVSVFGTAGVQTPMLISDVFVTSLDTTAGNITVENPAGTVVATIAKGATSGALVGAVTLANTTLLAGTNLIVKSSSAGNALVKIIFTNTNSGI